MFNLNFEKIKIKFRFQFIKRFCIGCFCPWIILVLSFVLIMISMSVFSISLHQKIDKGVAFLVSQKNEEEGNIKKINEEILKRVVSEFELKEKVFGERKKMNNLGIIDPAI